MATKKSKSKKSAMHADVISMDKYREGKGIRKISTKKPKRKLVFTGELKTLEDKMAYSVGRLMLEREFDFTIEDQEWTRERIDRLTYFSYDEMEHQIWWERLYRANEELKRFR